MEFCPGVYEHAAALIGRRPWDVSRAGALIAEAQRAGWQLYQHRLLVVGIDVYNVESEALGASVGEPPGNGVPAIVQHPFSELEELASLPDFDAGAGRVPQILTAARKLVAACPAAEVRVPVCGPMAFASGLLGMENLLMGLIEDPVAAAGALERLMAWQTSYFRAIHAAGARPIVFESGTTPPLLSVGLFEQVEAPLLGRLFDAAEAVFGERPPCIIGGNAAPVAPSFLACSPGYVIAPSETDQQAFLNAAEVHPNIHVRINISAALLSASDFAPIQAELDRIRPIVKGRANLSIGCGVAPYEANPQTVQQIQKAVVSWT